MFYQNKYSSLYYRIIERARHRNLDQYTESHHVIPRCIGGDDSPENLVNLTAREHFICHRLLTKMHDSNKIKYGFIMMSLSNDRQQRDFKITSRTYQTIKELNSSLAKERFTGKQKHNVGRKRYHDPLTGKEVMTHSCPDGFVHGMSQETRSSLKNKNLGKVYFYNSTLDKTIALQAGKIPPDGYVIGNPRANVGYLNVGKKEFYDPLTGITVKSKDCPDGFIKGSAWIWINNGVSQRQINYILEKIPSGWFRGLVIRADGEYKKRSLPVMTPFGRFEHPCRFAEKYGSNVFGDLDCVMRIRNDRQLLNDALKEVGYDFAKTKRENGFYFIESE